MRDLTKWPRLLVHGKPVARDQANEILVRTDGWYFSGNDPMWEEDIYAALGIKYESASYGVRVDYDDLRRVKDECRALDLEYLANERIYSAWIGGPHGWCDWDGTIGCSTYNIGKWPSVETVDAEWKAIAKAFPYLDLRAQLVPDEGADEYPVCEWRIVGGYADLVEPTGLLRTPAEPSIDMFGLMVRNSGRERGVNIPRLVEAVEQVRRQSV